MSHRDQERHIAPKPHAQDLLAVFRWLLADVDCSKIRFREDCSFSARGLIVAALLWVWSDQDALTRRFTAARKIAHKLWPGDVPASISYQAFLKRLVRWTAPLMAVLTLSLRQRMQTSLKSRFHIGDFSVFGVDGSRLQLPRTAANEAYFSPTSSRRRRATRRSRKRSRQSNRSRRKKADSPQLWITTMWHAGTGLPWDWRNGPSDSSERAHLQEMIAALPDDALVTADAGFVGYGYWKALIDSGREFVIRVGGNVRMLKKLGYVRESQGTVYLWPDQKAKRNEPPLALRLVVVNDGRQPWFLVTSVRSPSRLSDHQIAELYRLRWGIELFYRHFKQTFGRRKLRSRTAEHVRCEADWCIIGLWAMLLHAAQHLHRHHIAPERISVAGVLHAYRTAMREYKSDADPHETLWDLLAIALIDTYHRKNKQSRAYPRKKQNTPTSPPEITKATRAQIQLAQQIRKTNDRKGLTA
jgi:hypothetical protein